MPDQSSAATEHAILSEITRPLSDLHEDPLAMVDADFPVSMRGYDRDAVDRYVRQTRQLVAELQATRSPEAAVRRALERVGEQISGILQRAHETAEQITAQSRSEAEDRLEVARAEAAQITQAAEQRVRELDADTDRIWLERQRIVADAEDLAGQLTALAKIAADRFPADEDVAAVHELSPAAEPGLGAGAAAGKPAPAEQDWPTRPFDVASDSADDGPGFSIAERGRSASSGEPPVAEPEPPATGNALPDDQADPWADDGADAGADAGAGQADDDASAAGQAGADDAPAAGQADPWAGEAAGAGQAGADDTSAAGQADPWSEDAAGAGQAGAEDASAVGQADPWADHAPRAGQRGEDDAPDAGQVDPWAEDPPRVGAGQAGADDASVAGQVDPWAEDPPGAGQPEAESAAPFGHAEPAGMGEHTFDQAETEPPIAEPENREQAQPTVAFDAMAEGDEPAGSTDPGEPDGPPRRPPFPGAPASAIPPASQAAHRRFWPSR